MTVNVLKRTLFALVALGAGGCSYGMNSTMDSWQNRNLSEVIAAWGPASEEMKIEGKKLYIWNSCDGQLIAPNARRPKDAKCCSRLLEADNAGKIVHGAWEGSDCPWLFTGWSR
jgi:hypothetical protein